MENVLNGLIHLVDAPGTARSSTRLHCTRTWMGRLVDPMLVFDHPLAGADCEMSDLQLQIAAFDRAINSLVFRLYNLSDSDITTLTGNDR